VVLRPRGCASGSERAEPGKDKCRELINDPERRAKRIAAHYAELYFESAEKSRDTVQFYWPALAAFVVKDIVGAFKYSRDNVFDRGVVNYLKTSFGIAYKHAMRVYINLAKGNLWLFMDIYPWLWFFLDYGIKKSDGSVKKETLTAAVEKRSAETLQNQSCTAVKQLPFGQAWLQRQQAWQATDKVWTRARIMALSGKSSWANWYVQNNVAKDDVGYCYLMPTTKPNHWAKFSEAYPILKYYRTEMTRINADTQALKRLEKIAQFGPTQEIREAFGILGAMPQHVNNPKRFQQEQLKELNFIAKHEQLNVLQPLLYDDATLKETLDLNHEIARRSAGWLSPEYRVIYTADFDTSDPDKQTVFNPSDEPIESLANEENRMKYVKQIAKDFHRLMTSPKRESVEKDLKKIIEWKNA